MFWEVLVFVVVLLLVKCVRCVLICLVRLIVLFCVIVLVRWLFCMLWKVLVVLLLNRSLLSLVFVL